MFSNKLKSLRLLGRKLVLPTSQIKRSLKEKIPEVNGVILDLG